jgi:MFS family permease
MLPGAGDRWRLAALSMVMLLPSLGTSIANVSLPSLEASFQAPFEHVQWVVIGYLVAVTTLIVGAGRLGDLFGRRRPLLMGIGLFALASAACALAPDIWTLVLLRGVQGAGAALMMALTIASVGDMVSPERTGTAMGLLGTVSAVGTALGPSLGGALIAAFGWALVFWFLAAVGALTLLFAYRMLPRVATRRREPASFDLVGTLLLVVILGTYALATTIGSSMPASTVITLGAVSLGALLTFAAVEHQSDKPLLQLDLLRDRSLSVALIALALVSAIVMSTLVVGPFYLGKGLGLDPLATGLAMSVGPAVAALVGVPAGRLVDRFGSRRSTILGLAAVIAGSALMALVPAAWGVVAYAGNLAIITAGYGLFQAANNTGVVSRAPAAHRGVVSGLLGLARNLGLITGASAMGAVFALGSRGIATLTLAPGAETGMHLTFAAATLLGLLALGLLAWAEQDGH